MDDSLKEYAPYWLIGYYHLERKSESVVKYHYRTSVIGIHEFLGGVQRLLESHHQQQVVIVFIEPVHGFKQDFKKENVYVNFVSFAKKLVTDELTKRCSTLNDDFERQAQCILDVQGLRSHEYLLSASETVKKIISKEVNDELVEKVSVKLRLFWEKLVLEDLLK